MSIKYKSVNSSIHFDKYPSLFSKPNKKITRRTFNCWNKNNQKYKKLYQTKFYLIDTINISFKFYLL